MKISLALQTLAALQRRGWDGGVVERWIPYTNPPACLKGYGDIVVSKSGEPLVMVRTTTPAKLKACCDEVIGEHRLLTWFVFGGRFEVWCWETRGRGKKVHGKRFAIDPPLKVPEPQPWQRDEMGEWFRRTVVAATAAIADEEGILQVGGMTVDYTGVRVTPMRA